MNPISSDRTYRDFLQDIKNRIAAARIKVARSVNSELIQLYWDIGRSIVKKQKEQRWGKSVVEMLSGDLKRAFPAVTGFSADNLWRMRQFYLQYSPPKFLEQAVPEIENRNNQNLEQNVPESTDQPTPSTPGVIPEQMREILCNVPWGHHIEILKKTDDIQAQLYYLPRELKGHLPDESQLRAAILTEMETNK